MSGGELPSDFKPKEFKDNLKLVAKHPLQFAKHVAGGELAGLGLGAMGGAFVTTPIALTLALKRNKKEIPKFWNSFKDTMRTGLLAESTGMGVAGSIVGGGKFFDKYKKETVKHASYSAGVINELEKIADIKINDEQTFSPSRLGGAIGGTAGLQFGIKQMWENIGKSPNGKEMQETILSKLNTLPFKERVVFAAKLSKNFILPAVLGTALGTVGGSMLGSSLEKASISDSAKPKKKLFDMFKSKK